MVRVRRDITVNPSEVSMFEGSYTALITPFKNGAVDADAFRSLVPPTGKARRKPK